MGSEETYIQNAIRLATAGVSLLFRANVGAGWFGSLVRQVGNTITLANARRISTGLPAGFSDLFGITPVVITPEMVGRTVGVFTAIEVKTGKGRVSKEQDRFLQVIRDKGGIAGVARSVDDVTGIVAAWQ